MSVLMKIKIIAENYVSNVKWKSYKLPKEALMKRFIIAIPFGLLLMLLASCSSTPEGTVAIKNLQQTIEQQIGQKVVVIGSVDTSAGGISITRLFRLYKGNDAVWASIPEDAPIPPQGVRVRVTGVVSEKDFPGGIGRRVYIEAHSINME